jgi:AcrR family transcriptional regulator
MNVLGRSASLESGPMAATTESRRQLILAAMIRVVGAKGYKDTAVADVIEEA